jgi:hypothetical protein
LEYALTPIAFAEAIARTADRRRHLLLGNGFSIAAWPSFRYDALVETVAGQSNRIEGLFERLETRDFERVARALLETQVVLTVHDGAEALAQAVAGDYADLRRLLVSAITRIHPAAPAELRDRYAGCVAFLDYFIGLKSRRGKRGKIFSTSYDLILYWTLLEGRDQLKCDDGFRGRGQELIWEGPDTQTVFYLHGALHLFQDGEDTRKLSVKGRLVDTVGRRIESDQVPLFISEGSSQEKRVRIAESDYLTAASEHLSAACNEAEARLFIFGHSLRDEDAHIFEKIAEGEAAEVFVSVRSADGPEAHAQMEKAAALWARKRQDHGGPPLTVFCFDPAEAAPWG